MSDFNVEAFIKPNSFPADAIDGYQVDAMLVKDVRALVAQLIPEGHVVVPRHQLDILARHLKYNRSHLITVEAKDALRIVDAALSPLPASSEPEQTKDPNGGMPFAEFEKLVTDCAKDGAEPMRRLSEQEAASLHEALKESVVFVDDPKDRAEPPRCQALPCNCHGKVATHQITYADGSVRPISEYCATQHLITGFKIEPLCHAPAPAAKEVSDER